MTEPYDPSLYCRTCRYALTVWTAAEGQVTRLEHALDFDATAGHAPDPVPLAGLPGAIQMCDFCDGRATFVYTVSEQLIANQHIVTARWVTGRDRLDRGPAARARRTQTEHLRTDLFGRRHAACPACAALIENADISRLVTRAVDSLPAKLVRGKKLLAVRAELYTSFNHVLGHRLPGRHRITETRPLGVWEPGPEPTAETS